MKKTAVIYWSGTGNTAAMANAVLAGMKEAGADAVLMTSASVDINAITSFDAIAFGCPSMGDEQLEETEFEPMFTSCKSKLSGKKVGLFGSYGWGDGDWMRTWEADCKAAGIDLAAQSVICCELPDAAAVEECKQLGKSLAA